MCKNEVVLWGMRTISALITISTLNTGCSIDEEQEVDPWFYEATLEPEFLHANAVWAGAALLDYDNDGLLDLFLTNGQSHPDALYRNMGDGTFVDKASTAGVNGTGESGSVVSGDIDNDGDTDLVVALECQTGSWGENGHSAYDGGKVLYRNNGDGTFTEEEIILTGEPTPLSFCAISMTLADLDLDGYLDLIVSNGNDPDLAPSWIFDKHAVEAVNTIIYNNGEGSFEDYITIEGTVVTFATAVLDVNNDGLPDLILGQGGSGVEVFLQTAHRRFDPDIARSESGRGLWMGLAVADYNVDGNQDIYATNQGLSPLILGYDGLEGFYPGNTQVVIDPWQTGSEFSLVSEWVNPFSSLLLQSDEGLFTPALNWPLDAPQELAGDLFSGLDGKYEEWINPENTGRYGWSWGATAIDVDADSYPDVAFTSNNCGPPMEIIWSEDRGAGPGGLLMNNGGVGFTDVTWESGVANLDAEGRYPDGRGVYTGDLNNDGYPDLVFTNRTYNTSETSAGSQELGGARVLLSEPREGGWLQIDPVGTVSNRDGIGSTLTITAPDGTIREHILGAEGSTNGSNERLFTVGLGSWDKVDFSLRFPSGRTVDVSGANANNRYTITEP